MINLGGAAAPQLLYKSRPWCTAWWIASCRSSSMFNDVKIVMTLLSDAHSTIGHHYFILNHLC